MIPIEDVFREKAEKEREAFGVLYPSKEELPERIKLITTTRGKPPTITALLRAKVIFGLLDAMERGEIFDWSKVDPAEFYREHAPSLGGRHAERAVDIARAAPKEPIEATWLERFLGKK